MRILPFASIVMATVATGLSSAQSAEATFFFEGQPRYEIHIKLDDNRNISGEIRSGQNVVVSTVTGINRSPGHLALRFDPGSVNAPQGNFIYQFRPCETPTRTLFTRPYCGNSAWISQATGRLSKFKSCNDECQFFSNAIQSDEFETTATWSMNVDHYIGTLSVAIPRAKRPRLISCLRESGIRASFQGAFLNVPPAMEQTSIERIRQCGFGNAELTTTEKGSSSIPLIFSDGTFFTERPNLNNLASIVASIRNKLRDAFSAEGLETDVKQGPIGGLDFIITLTGHADQFPFPAGNWFQTEAELKITERSVAHVPSGRIQHAELHVIGTQMFHGPRSSRPSSNQFQPIAVVDRRLRDTPVDSSLAIEIANRLGSKFGGAVSNAPEGF